ncbi:MULTISPECIES: 3' terminal RNA ribose 2'-O-methyltransferase Hen1 [unclassified Mesorhizobium]|uniref:3' terminal RNA ribose 2'-O-methyltransferase Hen1 n=1 Tax=unclassified Mesorhizobium TaxID=325217 RepID=UPI000BB0A827|nr:MULTISPECIES: 3' terminal RNA ribose 2'-O-methyltransferase Hen1 [unclassified Mesorhizobium]TGT57330.1 3' terminal RNA ribose 2'-O-methyltransferase Hen1 [Mesorhizobium sp. M00.F.Ca.ET.170.01.1.1]AZO11938.1 3' terminal RNA ribose 2'-O-methyltransferase Hen1 [Mesorhizobium sp. M3A.F.Ca.ET.080.04.2.1]PBB86168.1 3' terminal RNA ribose 2'-O-methyltransferase Hen1 [Mesorhizobium sp. WSM3876]RWB73221.1 MAG: 3' terminal RNA ribose 2'-O-methyltransferase Hen1 [Mesorhizobium sp.]RWB83270.1 MAG: 3' 
MFLSVATTHRPATDLGFLLYKHPDRLHETDLAFGKAWLFYPEATEQRCEAALLLDIDPIGLVRGKGQAEGLLDQYVNDRPYAASSFLSVALNKTLRTAMTGISKERQDLANSDLPLEAVLTPLPMLGGEALVRELFEPLGWTVDLTPIENAGHGAGNRQYGQLKLTGKGRLSGLLNHLYVLIPVLDDAKHYWVGEAEIDKLLSKGEGWLENHPAKDVIVRRYLRNRGPLARIALERLAPETVGESLRPEVRSAPEEALEMPIRLNDLRMDAVVDAIRATGANVIADLGCGEGKLLYRLVRERWVHKLFGLDPAIRELEWAAKRLKLNEFGGPPEGRVTLLHGSLTYRDSRWAEADVAVMVEVIEHLDEDRLPLVERIVFGETAPKSVIVTTPNADYNALFPNLGAGNFRHPDHRFEWSRAQFEVWAAKIGETYGYAAAFSGIGAADTVLGAPTQMAVFTR